MRRLVARASLLLALVGGVALAAQNEPIAIQNETLTIVESGQTFDLTATSISAEVVFTEVTPTRVTASVRLTAGTSGTFRIYWREADEAREFRLSITDPYRLFSLEGGDTDKKTNDRTQP